MAPSSGRTCSRRPGFPADHVHLQPVRALGVVRPERPPEFQQVLGYPRGGGEVAAEERVRVVAGAAHEGDERLPAAAHGQLQVRGRRRPGGPVGVNVGDGAAEHRRRAEREPVLGFPGERRELGGQLQVAADRVRPGALPHHRAQRVPQQLAVPQPARRPQGKVGQPPGALGVAGERGGAPEAGERPHVPRVVEVLGNALERVGQQGAGLRARQSRAPGRVLVADRGAEPDPGVTGVGQPQVMGPRAGELAGPDVGVRGVEPQLLAIGIRSLGQVGRLGVPGGRVFERQAPLGLPGREPQVAPPRCPRSRGPRPARNGGRAA